MPEEIKPLRERAIDEFVAMWTWTEADTTARLTVDAMREYFETNEFKQGCGHFFDLARPRLGIFGDRIITLAIATYTIVREPPSGNPEYLFDRVKSRIGGQRFWCEELELHILMFATKVLDWDDNWTRACPMDSDESYARYYRLMDKIVLPTQKSIADTERWHAEAEQENAAHRRAQIEAAQATLMAARLEERVLAMPDADLPELKSIMLANGTHMRGLLGDRIYDHVVHVINQRCK